MAFRQGKRSVAAWGLVLGLVASAPAAPRRDAAPAPERLVAQSSPARPAAPNEARPPAPPPPVVPGTPATIVTIPAGEFWMGRTRLWLMDEIGWQIRERYDDRPVHRVRLEAFSLDAHEVTNAEYAAFAASPDAGVAAPYHWGGPRPAGGQGPPARLQRDLA